MCTHKSAESNTVPKYEQCQNLHPNTSYCPIQDKRRDIKTLTLPSYNSFKVHNSQLVHYLGNVFHYQFLLLNIQL